MKIVGDGKLGTRTRVLFMLVVIASGCLPFTLGSIAISAQNASAINCKDFIDQAEAQRFFLAKGGPTLDPYHLDEDGDGVACEPGPAPTPVSREHAEYCEGFLDYLSDGGGSSDKYRRECADYIEQKRGYQRCPAYKGLSYVYFSRLNRSQVNALSDMQRSEYDNLMNLSEGECVAVDVAKTTAWQCQPFPFYISEYERAMFIPIPDNYRDQLSERYEVVCMGAPISIGERSFTTWQVVLATAAGAVGGIYLYGRLRRPTSDGAEPAKSR